MPIEIFIFKYLCQILSNCFIYYINILLSRTMFNSILVSIMIRMLTLYMCINLLNIYIGMVFSCGEGLVLSPDGKGCVDKNECLYFPCRNGGSCVNREPGYRCHCPEGFWGENCELVQEGRTLKLSMGALAAILVCLLIIMSEHLATLSRDR